jgi:hypothetical protein
MVDNQHLLNELSQLLSWKRSKSFYANKLGITEVEVEELMNEIRKESSSVQEAEIASYIGELEDVIVKYEEDLKKGVGEVVVNCKSEITSLDELIAKCNIDTSVWEITKYIQNYWGNNNNPYYQVKAWLGKKREEVVFQDAFIEFLSTYDFSSEEIPVPLINKRIPSACIVINKQDAHFDKYDIKGQNSISNRFIAIWEKITIILSQARLSNNLEKIIYIVGSDEFNSEFTQNTTKGTPQQNILNYHETFKMVCEYEKLVISTLLNNAESVDVIYVPGNHDEYIGWHLIHWLKAVFVNERIAFDCNESYRKFVGYGTSAMMFNHGDAIKPSKLAAVFPMEYKESWSTHENFYIFTGDKHHELSQDFNGVKFYQVPAFSKSSSRWDDKQGYTCSKGEVTAFLIDKEEGMTNIFKQYL